LSGGFSPIVFTRSKCYNLKITKKSGKFLFMRTKTFFFCVDCGHRSARWLGRCPGCGSWNSLVEEKEEKPRVLPSGRPAGEPVPVTEVPPVDDERISTGIEELDRVLGGGVVPGSLVLLGGDPGIGKSTLLLQAAFNLSGKTKVLYISGEESVRQVRLRAERLGALSPELFLLAETDVDEIERVLLEFAPAVAVVDSIQTVCKGDLASAPGSVGQVRECAAQLMRLAKSTGMSVFLVGHVTKEGVLAGPRVLEHMVDAVLYLEGDRHQFYRILRGVKNRFGSTNEIGIFEMKSGGLAEVPNPSAHFLVHRLGGGVPGSAVAASLEGTRPLLVEVQALVTPTAWGVPRRMTAGLDSNRVALIAAVLEKRVGLNLAGHDLYVNAAGGVRLEEPAADLAVALALASSYRDVPVEAGLACAGEIGLTGEIRPVTGIEARQKEAFKLGFAKFLMPGRAFECTPSEGGSFTILAAQTLDEALQLALMA